MGTFSWQKTEARHSTGVGQRGLTAESYWAVHLLQEESVERDYGDRAVDETVDRRILVNWTKLCERVKLVVHK